MTTLGLSIHYKVRHCSQCQGDTEFYCNTCKYDMCLQCKERHVIDLDTKCHDVVIYREKFSYIPRQEICVRHPDRIYEMFCQSCELSVCFRCLEHRKHQILDIKTAYQTTRQQHRQTVDNIRSETLYNCRVLLKRIKNDIQTCASLICHRRPQISTKAQRLKYLIDTGAYDLCLVNARIQQQKRKMNRHLTHIQNYEDKYEQSANRAVQFLLFIKTSRVSQINKSPDELLSIIPEIRMSKAKLQVGMDFYVKMTSTPVLHTSVCVPDVSSIVHISRVSSDRVWISDRDNRVMTDTTGKTIQRVTDRAPRYGGLHSVNSSGELIYVDKKFSINKLSTIDNTITSLTTEWTPHCVYSSLDGYLLVGMRDSKTKMGQVARYNSDGHKSMAIIFSQGLQQLYGNPWFITENTNRDIVVSDRNRKAIVVTDLSGRHRFSYRSPPSRRPLKPRGICTDALSHILLCDSETHTIQMIDKDGHFLSLLLTRQQHGIYKPLGLNYDDKTHLLWVGSGVTNIVSAYRYIQRKYIHADIPGTGESDHY